MSSFSNPVTRTFRMLVSVTPMLTLTHAVTHPSPHKLISRRLSLSIKPPPPGGGAPRVGGGGGGGGGWRVGGRVTRPAIQVSRLFKPSEGFADAHGAPSLRLHLPRHHENKIKVTSKLKSLRASSLNMSRACARPAAARVSSSVVKKAGVSAARTLRAYLGH